MLSSIDWLRGRTNGRGERKAQRTQNPQTQCPDESGELEETEDESEEHVSEEIAEREWLGTSERETAETGEDDRLRDWRRRRSLR